MLFFVVICFFFQAEDGIRDLVRSRGLGDVYKRQMYANNEIGTIQPIRSLAKLVKSYNSNIVFHTDVLSLIHI